MSEIYLTRLAKIAQVTPTTLRSNVKTLLDLLEKKEEVKND